MKLCFQLETNFSNEFPKLRLFISSKLKQGRYMLRWNDECMTRRNWKLVAKSPSNGSHMDAFIV